ncbi:MAG: hypothetical protein DCF32_15060 [Leptolyngbya sp.]|nr:MAG: hypothetical protein DCF32_15060 [Leptolyngbya sp.]
MATPPEKKAKPGPKPGESNRTCTEEGCDRDHYAKGLCFRHWRASKGYKAGGDRAKANANYDNSDQGKKRHDKSYQKRQIIKKLTGATSITAAFADPVAIAKLREKRAALEAVWDYFTDEQKAILSQE